MKDLSRPAIEPMSPALAGGLNFWMTREVPGRHYFYIFICVCVYIYIMGIIILYYIYINKNNALKIYSNNSLQIYYYIF